MIAKAADAPRRTVLLSEAENDVAKPVTITRCSGGQPEPASSRTIRVLLVGVPMPATVRGVPIRDIPAVFAGLPQLAPEDAAEFGRDIAASRTALRTREPRDPWAS